MSKYGSNLTDFRWVFYSLHKQMVQIILGFSSFIYYIIPVKKMIYVYIILQILINAKCMIVLILFTIKYYIHH